MPLEKQTFTGQVSTLKDFRIIEGWGRSMSTMI